MRSRNADSYPREHHIPGAPDSDRELVTFALFTHNQYGTVREALLSALAQDYSPLEVLISDDASRDSTHDVIMDTLSRTHSVHDVRVLRNEPNLGIALHVSRVLREAKGRLVVLAAGDDISGPDRVAALVREWKARGAGTMYLSSDAQLIDGDGRVIAPSARSGDRPDSLAKLLSGEAMPLGATEACTKDLITLFGDLPADILNEDWALPFRAALLGTLAYVDRPLVQYRVSAGAVSQNQHVQTRESLSIKKADYHARLLLALDCMQSDLDRLKEVAPDRAELLDADLLHSAIQSRRRIISLMEQLYRARANSNALQLVTLIARHPVQLPWLALCYIARQLKSHGRMNGGL